ncbi:MAG: sugar ABC transporter permease [Clostridiales bacterium]|nr:sugar ABC transporter permease [Clostridiales bacterium]
MSKDALRYRREKALERRSRVWSALEPVAYLLPFMVSIIVFTVYPFFNVVFMSFREGFDLLPNTDNGIGLGNYAFVLSNRDFINALTTTGIYVAVVVPVSAELAIVLANLLNRKVRGMAIFQTAYFLPMVTSAMAVGLAWRYIFLRDFGVLNQVLGWFGVDKINWLQRYPWSLYALIIFGIWSNLPFTIILILSGLQNIDETYYTAARVDGARSTRIFFRITVPLLAPTIGLVLTINTISASKVFSELFALFNGPGIGGSLFTVVYYIYEQFAKQKHAWAAAAAMILFVLIFIATMVQQYIQRKWTY